MTETSHLAGKVTKTVCPRRKTLVAAPEALFPQTAEAEAWPRAMMQKCFIASEATGNCNACLHPAATRHGRHAHKPLAATSLGLACTVTKAHSAFFQYKSRPPRLCPCPKTPCNGACLQRSPCAPQATAVAEKEMFRRRASLHRERDSTALH